MERKEQEYQSITVRISKEERKMANELRDVYYIKVSKIVGESIRSFYKKIKNDNNRK